MAFSGLLTCSVCDSEIIEISGKEGVVIQTRCSNCGLTSDDFTEKYLQDSSSPCNDNHAKQPQVYYRKAPASSR
jgi:hypothetical protein